MSFKERDIKKSHLVAVKLFERLIQKTERVHILSDLDEEFTDIVIQKGYSKAALWYE